MKRIRPLLVLLVGIAAGAGATYFTVAPKSPSTSSVGKGEDLPNRSLDANLYMQISAEYRAACYQTYEFAYSRLRELLLTRKNDGHQFAIILDLDETVFDNGAFQARQLKAGSGYDQKAWDEYEKQE